MLMTIVLVAGVLGQAAQAGAPAVVFVCEHGAAKSVVATAYFNKLAAERGLPFRATFRGTAPQDNLSVRAVEGLKADGVAVPTGKPSAISDTDVADATHIFAIGCTLPEKAVRSADLQTGIGLTPWALAPDGGGVAVFKQLRHADSSPPNQCCGSPKYPKSHD